MYREVEFRGKHIHTNRWVYGGYYKHLKRTPNPLGDKVKDDDWVHLIIKSGFSDWNMPKPLECNTVNEETIGQYTGLKDKYGRKIYEGDILSYTHSAVGTITRVVTYKGGSYGIEGTITGTHIPFGNILNNEIKVVGNIHDDIELILDVRE